MNIKVLVIRTDFKHHGELSGYKQILRYLNPYKIFGINERDSSVKVPGLKIKYQWLFEFEASKNRGDANIIHILYGEDYFRWSTRLFKGTPVVATFHQPAELLRREVLSGNLRGRVGHYTHLLSKKRFNKLSAAIVTNPTQKEVLKEVMPESRIHVIPLGIHLDEMKKKFQEHTFLAKVPNNPRIIISVGNWLRDWEFYFKVVEKCKEWKFILVNQKLDDQNIAKAKQYDNLVYYSKISDDELYDLFLMADAQFISVTGMAASNSLIQGLALGCPLVLTDIDADEYKNEEALLLYESGNVQDCINKISSIVNLKENDLNELKLKSHLYTYQFSWEEVANRTLNLYKELLGNSIKD